MSCKKEIKEDGLKAEDNSESSSCSEDSDGEENWEKIKRKRQLLQQANQKTLVDLNITSITQNITNAIAPKQRKLTKTNKSSKPKAAQLVLPRRRSLRLVKSEEEKSQIKMMQNDIQVKQEQEELKYMVPSGDVNLLSEDPTYKGYLAKFQPGEIKAEGGKSSESLDSFIADAGKTLARGCSMRKVVEKRITTIAISSSPAERLLVVGDKSGNLGLWNVDGREDEESPTFRVNSASLRCVRFQPDSNNRRVLTGGYDGKLRFFNLDNFVLEKSLIEDTGSVSYFDFQPDSGGNTVAVGYFDGRMSLEDIRSPPSKSDIHDVHDRVIKCVSFHPTHNNYLLTSSNDALVKMFDLRNLNVKGKKTKEVLMLTQHCKTVDSAFFSPLTGDKILTTSLDDTIKLFDSSGLTKVKLERSVPHCNQTGRWLSNMVATWHPNREDLFFVGSMNRPRRIEMYEVSSMRARFVYAEENLATVCPIIQHHPTLNMFAGGNSSGKVYVYHD